jgi:hypothetical protein
VPACVARITYMLRMHVCMCVMASCCVCVWEHIHVAHQAHTHAPSTLIHALEGSCLL